MDGKLNNLSFKRYIRFVTSRTVASTNEDLLTDDEMAREKGRFFSFSSLFFFVQASNDLRKKIEQRHLYSQEFALHANLNVRLWNLFYLIVLT